MRNVWILCILALLAIVITSCQRDEVIDITETTEVTSTIDWEAINAMPLEQKLDTLKKLLPNEKSLKTGGRGKFDTRNQTAMNFIQWHLQNRNSVDSITRVDIMPCSKDMSILKMASLVMRYDTTGGLGIGFIYHPCSTFILTVEKKKGAWTIQSHAAIYIGAYVRNVTTTQVIGSGDTAASFEIDNGTPEFFQGLNTLSDWFTGLQLYNTWFDNDFEQPGKRYYHSVASATSTSAMMVVTEK